MEGDLNEPGNYQARLDFEMNSHQDITSLISIQLAFKNKKIKVAVADQAAHLLHRSCTNYISTPHCKSLPFGFVLHMIMN
jgi:hypothetical protein